MMSVLFCHATTCKAFINTMYGGTLSQKLIYLFFQPDKTQKTFISTI